MIIVDQKCENSYLNATITDIYRRGKVIHLSAELQTYGDIIGEYRDESRAIEVFKDLMESIATDRCPVYYIPQE